MCGFSPQLFPLQVWDTGHSSGAPCKSLNHSFLKCCYHHRSVSPWLRLPSHESGSTAEQAAFPSASACHATCQPCSCQQHWEPLERRAVVLSGECLWTGGVQLEEDCWGAGDGQVLTWVFQSPPWAHSLSPWSRGPSSGVEREERLRKQQAARLTRMGAGCSQLAAPGAPQWSGGTCKPDWSPSVNSTG